MQHRVPDLVPVLGRGKHRNPRRGACFMEFASYLAGERWSDHPACTDPVLAGLARSVNDHVGDAARSRLVPLVPAVVGLVSHRPDSGVRIARECALAALPVVSESRQRVMALAVLRCEAVLGEAAGLPAGSLTPRATEALAVVPMAERWARSFRPHARGGRTEFSRIGVPTIIESAVDGISVAVTDDPDGRLVTLLERVVERCEEWFGVPPLTRHGLPATRLPEQRLAPQD